MAFEVVVVAVVAAIKPRKAFIFGSQSIMSSSPAATFHQPACQAHSGQCEAKHSLGYVSLCVTGSCCCVFPYYFTQLGAQVNIVMCFFYYFTRKIIEKLFLICCERKHPRRTSPTCCRLHIVSHHVALIAPPSNINPSLKEKKQKATLTLLCK